MVKNSYRRLWVIILTIISTTAFSQTDETDIQTTIRKFFDGLKLSDTAAIRSAFTPQPVLQTIVKSRDGRTMVATERLDSFLISIAAPHEVYDERIQIELIKIDAELAMVWTPYRFYIGDTFSHCGVNSIQLVKWNGRWRIQYIIDTRRREGCE